MEAHWVEESCSIESKKTTKLDGWPIGELYRFPQHKTIEDRLRMTGEFIKEFDFEVPMFVDTMQDTFNNKFHIWPDKCIIIKNNGKRSEILFTALLDKNGIRTIDGWAKKTIDFIEKYLQCDDNNQKI